MLSQLHFALQECTLLIERVLKMPDEQGVVDVSVSKVEKCHQEAVKALRDVQESRHKQLIHLFYHFFGVWRVLKDRLIEGWDVFRIQDEAKACHLSLLALTQLVVELQKAQKEQSADHFWYGDSFRVCLDAGIQQLKTHRSAGLNQLYQTLRRCINFSDASLRDRGIQEFFRTLARLDVDLAARFLEVFNIEYSELKDIALATILHHCPCEKIESVFELLVHFSSDRNRELGLEALFLNCYQKDPELAFRLIKKMPSKIERNRALCSLSLARAKAGRLDEAEMYKDMVTSQVMKQDLENTIKELEPDTRQVYQGDELIKAFIENSIHNRQQAP